MKRTISLSLLLLIAGNGLMVTQAHADLRGAQKIVGVLCLIFGGASLLKGCGWAVELNNQIKQLYHDKHSLDQRIIANPDNDPRQQIPIDELNIKNTKNTLLQQAALGIPLVALGTYLIKKA